MTKWDWSPETIKAREEAEKAISNYLRLSNKDIITNDPAQDPEDLEYLEDISGSQLVHWAVVGMFQRFDEHPDQARVMIGTSGLPSTFSGGMFTDAANICFER